MGKLYSLISALLLTVSASFAAAPDRYEWWFDHDVSSAQPGTLSGGNIDLEIDASRLPEGVHFFNLRLAEGDSVFGPVYRKMFHALGSEATAISYEYWFDGSFASRTAGAVAAGAAHLDLDVSSLPPGVRYFNLRLGYGDDRWSPPYRKMLLNLPGYLNASAYEYWIDNNHAGTVSGQLSSADDAFEVDLTGVRRGLHRFNYRLMTPDGTWGAPFTSYFFSTAEDLHFTDYEYWLDNDYANRVSGTADGDPTEFEIDMSAFDKSGAHYFNLRTRDGEGGWSPVYRKLIVFRDRAGQVPLLGYSHFLNETDLGYVNVERQIVDIYEFDVDLPDSYSASVKDKLPLFDGDRITIGATDSIDYSIQLETELGWSPPTSWRLEIGGEYSATAVEIAVNSRHEFATPSLGEFSAVKFTSTGSPLHFRTDIPIALDLYKDGAKVGEVEPHELASMATLVMVTGEYYGILRDAEGDVPERFTFQLLDAADRVTPPSIEFADGTVTITCTTPDAEVHYTVDDPDINEESPLYTEPIIIDRNATIRAFAILPGLDIEPSDTVTYVIDSYKVATPYGRFDRESRMLTIGCDTEGASIFYRLDMAWDWIPYSAPFAVEESGVIYAMAKRDGWNDSDVAEIEISDAKCADVVISYNGRYVTLTTDEPDAVIRYGFEDIDPIIDYTGPFDAEGLHTISAVAVKEGYMDSDIAELTITRYADEEHAETAAEGLLASAFDWDENGLRNNVEEFRIEGRLNEADYEFIRSMNGLRHLDIENVTEARIPDYAFVNSKLISISLPEDIAEYGDSILSTTPILSSVIWNSRTMVVRPGVTQGLQNPNALLYVPAETAVTDSRGVNVVRNGRLDGLTLRHGYPYYAARDFIADRVSLTHDFRQTTEIDVCRGWETIVLPFQPTEITHETRGAAVPFAAWNGDLNGPKPFWLYRATANDWVAADEIEACMPYIISMPCNPEYVPEFNLGGKVTFSAYGVRLGPDRSYAQADSWIDGTGFEGTFMPLDRSDVLSLNVGSTDGGLQPGSTFVPDGVTLPFGAYVSGAGRRAMPLFGGASGVDALPTIDDGLLIETPAPGTLRITSGHERNVAVTTLTGVTIRILRLKPGETATLEGLTRDLYIVAGRKATVR